MIFVIFRVSDEFNFSLKWYQSKWTKGIQPLSCPALSNLKSGREELRSTRNQAGKSYFLFIQCTLLMALDLAKQKF